ncbi:hypothetical protein [Rheinheimera gaetbuli]
MDYIGLISLLTAGVDTTATLGQIALVADANATDASSCYRQGAFSFGGCDLSTVPADSALSYAWILVNLLFAAMFFNPTIKRGWKVLAFLVGIPGTLFIAVFMLLFGNRRLS